MNRRLTTFVLAAFYLLQGTWLLHAGMDLLLPTVRTAVAAADSCCSNACGCPEDVKKAHGCCCNKSAPVREAAKSVPRSAIEEARCKGIEDAMTQAFTQPVVGAFAAIPAPVVESTEATLPDLQPFLALRLVSLDKVPIAQA